MDGFTAGTPSLIASTDSLHLFLNLLLPFFKGEAGRGSVVKRKKPSEAGFFIFTGILI